jgi:hypothetical protein
MQNYANFGLLAIVDGNLGFVAFPLTTFSALDSPDFRFLAASTLGGGNK